MENVISQPTVEEKQPYGYAFTLLTLEGKDAPDVKRILMAEFNLSDGEASGVVEQVQEDTRQLKYEFEMKEVKQLLLIGAAALAGGIILTWLLSSSNIRMAFVGLMTFGCLSLLKGFVKWAKL